MGTDWVFLRGLIRESAHWDDFPARFAQVLPGARVHLVDLPGSGRHWRQPSPLNMAAITAAARREALGLMAAGQGGQPFYLLTISLGSMVAVEWAQRHPAELAGAVLINTSLRGLSPLTQRLCWRCWPLLARIVASGGDVARRERLIFELTSALPAPSPGFIDQRVAMQQNHPVYLANACRQLWAAACHRPCRVKPPIPLLLLNSLGDRMVDSACTQAIALAWQLEVKTHPWAGHDLPLDDPAWVAAAVAEWMLERRLPAGSLPGTEKA